MPGKNVGIIVVGDEILKGHVQDINSHFMCKRLLAIGSKVVKISVVGDDILDIANAVREFSKRFDVVITSGGIGPTHDDITYKGIAAAFDEDIVCNDNIFQFWKSVTDEESSIPMSSIPKSAQILWTNLNSDALVDDETKTLCQKFCKKFNKFPTVRVHNVFVFPGVPHFLKLLFINLEKDYFESHGCSIFTSRIYLLVHEELIVKSLNKTVLAFKDCVFGSYPAVANDKYKTQISVEAVTVERVKAAEDYFTSLIPVEWQSDWYQKMPNPVYQFPQCTADPRLAETLKTTIALVEQSFDSYSPESLMVSFNGGKDCTVLLHIVLAVKECKGIDQPLQVVYFKPSKPFPEVENFIKDTVNRYRLELTTLPGPIKPALEVLVKQKKDVKAIFLGTRRTDPFSQDLKPLQETDPGWTPLMRINPLLNWSYQDIWTFLRGVSVPYCALYDEGYTSLGNQDNTKPNPCLLYIAADGSERYHPAWMLTDDTVERSGRL